MSEREHVAHYAATEIETIDFIADKLGPEGFKAYVAGNFIKYASRLQYKGKFDEDLEKIRNYAVILQEYFEKVEGTAWNPDIGGYDCPVTLDELKVGDLFTVDRPDRDGCGHWEYLGGGDYRYYTSIGLPGSVWSRTMVLGSRPFKRLPSHS